MTTELLLGNIYLEILLREEPKAFPFVVKNIAFLIKSFPHAPEKAESHLQRVIEISREMGAGSIIGQACLNLGLLHKSKKRTAEARKCIIEAVQHFEQCEAELYLKQAKDALASL